MLSPEIFIQQVTLLQSFITVTMFFATINIEAAPGIADRESANLTNLKIAEECLQLSEIAKLEKYLVERNDDPKSNTGFPVINAEGLTSDDFARVEYNDSELSPFGDDQTDWKRLRILQDLLRHPQDDTLKSNFNTVHKFLVIAHGRLRSRRKVTENIGKEDRSDGENSSLEAWGEEDGDKRVTIHTSSTSSTSDGLPHRLYRSTLIHTEINEKEKDDAESLDDRLETTGAATSELEEEGKPNLYIKSKTTESMRVTTVDEYPTEKSNIVSKTLWDSGEDDRKSGNSVTTEITPIFDTTDDDFRSIFKTEEEQDVRQVFKTTLENLDTSFEGSTQTEITASNDFGTEISNKGNNFVTEIIIAENNTEIGRIETSDIEAGVYNTGVVITARNYSQSETPWKSILETFETEIAIENDTETVIHPAKNNSGLDNPTQVNFEVGNTSKKISEPEITTEIYYDSSIYGTMNSSELKIRAENNSGIIMNYNNIETVIADTENNLSTQIASLKDNNIETNITAEENNIKKLTAGKNNSDEKFEISESDENVETKITTLRNDIGMETSSEDGIEISAVKNDFETEEILQSSKSVVSSTEFSTVSQPSEKINGNPDDYRIISDRFQESLESTTVSSLDVTGISDIPYSSTVVENPPDISAVTKPEDDDKIAEGSGDEESELVTTIFHPSSTDRGIPVGEVKKNRQVILKIGDTLSPFNGITRSTEVGLVKIPGSKSGLKQEFSVPTNHVSRIYNMNDNDVANEDDGEENEESIDPKSSYNDPYNYATNFDSDYPHRHLPRYHRFDESLQGSDESKASRENHLSKNFSRPKARVPAKRGEHNTNLEKLYRWFYRIGQEPEDPDFPRRGLVVRYAAKPEIRCKESAKFQGYQR